MTTEAKDKPNLDLFGTFLNTLYDNFKPKDDPTKQRAKLISIRAAIRLCQVDRYDDAADFIRIAVLLGADRDDLRVALRVSKEKMDAILDVTDPEL